MDVSTWETLQALICKQLQIHRRHVKQQMNLYEDLDADQLDILNLFIRAENTFKIQMPGNEDNSFNGDISILINVINEKRSAQNKNKNIHQTN